MASTETKEPEVIDKLEELFEGDDHVPCDWSDESEMLCIQPAEYRHVCHCGASVQLCRTHFAYLKVSSWTRRYLTCDRCTCPIDPAKFFQI